MNKRKNTDCNAYELVFGAIYSNTLITSKKELLEYLENNNTILVINNKDEYIKDIVSRKEQDINNYIKQILDIEYLCDINSIDKIYVTGKSYSNIDELSKLNNGIDRKRSKADVFIKLKNGKFIGISIKQDNSCTKTNYSIEKFAIPIQEGKKLKETKQRFLKDMDLWEEAQQLNKKECINKHDIRLRINNIFHQKHNPYWIETRTIIEQYNQLIGTELVKLLYSHDIHYPMYEFDGDKLTKLSLENIKMDTIHLEEYDLDYYHQHKNAAKLFYKFNINGETKYRIEIRFKGSFTASSQYQIHEL